MRIINKSQKDFSYYSINLAESENIQLGNMASAVIVE